MLQTALLVLHILVAIALIAIILLQQGRGATAGASFGGGASSTVFGARGSATFLSRATAILATIFLGNCLLLAFLATKQSAPQSIGAQLEQQVATAPAVTAPATAVPAPTVTAPVVPTTSTTSTTAPADAPPIPSTNQ